MSKTARMFTMLGLGLMAGATIGAGPALAAGSADAPAAKPATTTKVQKHGDRDRIAGYFRTRGACERAGRIGEIRDRWDDYDCDRVRFGFKRGLWALEVEQNWRGGGHGHGPFGGHHGGHGGHHGHGPRR
ncbi:hypothetical protein OWR29_33445 [Actinoplanes sp. Pm04-4]|jgi:hypothetical protein|uniref:Uncharacterized protein n=1 Tax=Paractinoplanes pyxinae TaxID=2997416 RepID=A0ABT4B8U8_9ACTN|nr:hypothetical protein [Actinoplanes pyxinae]MCY1142925.1 hypothetical protein [Actinoplanes pyxinae]